MKRYRLVLAVVGVAASAALPWMLPSFFVTMLIRVMYFGLLAFSLTFMVSQLGLVSLGQASFFGVASYTVAILQVRYGIFFPFAPILAVLVVLALASVCALMAVRTRGVYFLMLTLVLGQIVYSVANQWSDFTRGDTGIVGVRPPSIGPTDSTEAFYLVSLLVFLAVAFLLYRLKNSPVGLMMRGVRHAESRMKMLGYPVQRIIFGVFVAMSFVAAAGGLINVYFVRLVNPTSVGLTLNVDTLVSGILGGVDTLSGAVLGTAILRTLSIALSGVTARYQLVTGLLFLAVVLFAPAGIVGIIQSRRRGTSGPGGERTNAKRD
ncbi:MAG: branched-chain amino acid ABC transporter permease [Spirochaetales bacterium]|nr:branched-chain amino acid ABC transporter permease [Spirochaetales bacterium]